MLFGDEECEIKFQSSKDKSCKVDLLLRARV